MYHLMMIDHYRYRQLNHNIFVVIIRNVVSNSITHRQHHHPSQPVDNSLVGHPNIWLSSRSWISNPFDIDIDDGHSLPRNMPVAVPDEHLAISAESSLSSMPHRVAYRNPLD
mmetsp:Transcript_28669/g.58517  ORF Transcript_28669/g.58517 Transcript_28669/m.58517 type:complete len:112 (-) Transcript_28669:730-1065(-)